MQDYSHNSTTSKVSAAPAPLLYAGRIRRSLEGGLLVLSDVAPNFQGFAAGTIVSIGFSQALTKAYRVRECAPSKNREFVMAVVGVNTTHEAATLHEMGVFVDEKTLRSSITGAYLEQDILGCTVVNAETQEPLGIVSQIWYMPAHDVWVADVAGKELPIPAVEAFIRNVDLSAKVISIYVMEGLLDLLSTSADGNHDDKS